MLTYFAFFVLFVLLIAASYFSIRFGITILKIQDTIEESLDIIDEKYSKINEICERPLFYDSPEVRSVLSEIKSVREAIHTIAKSLTDNFEEEQKK